VTCPNSKYLFNGECLDDCPFGYFISGSQCQGFVFFMFASDFSIINDEINEKQCALSHVLDVTMKVLNV